MAVPSYTTDLVDIDLCESGGKTWAEPTATGWTFGAAPASDDDNPFQGLLAMSKAYNATGVGGMMVNNGGAISLPTDGAFLVWFYWAAPGSLEADVDGGIRVMVGTDLNNFKSWDVGGKTSYVYGGWINYAVNTTIGEDDLVGTGLGNSQYVGAAVNNYNSIFKGNPFLCDATRYGRCEARIAGGETGNYATFSGFAAINDNVSYRWGLIQAITGGYLVKGLVTFGYGSVVDFRDSNKSLVIQNTNKVTANFNTFEVLQATSRVDLTSISITSLGTVSKGRWLTTANADINIESCVFTDMNTFTFLAQSTILNTTFRRCGIVTQGAAVFTGCKFDSASDTKALVVDTIGNVTNTIFISKGTGYAIEGFSSAGTYSLTGLIFTGYGANGTTDAAIHVLATSGIVYLGIGGGGTASPTVKSDGATIEYTVSVTLKIAVKDIDGNPMVGVRCYIDNNNESPFILDDVTDVNGEASVGYSGSPVSNATWRVRKYEYLPFQQLVNIGSENITLPVTLIDDPVY
uniref:Uncharacterized protein n=1 Tax=viral metagenome TaxID=1070528 RepID=A0A6H1ZYN7_9ZZZZ